MTGALAHLDAAGRNQELAWIAVNATGMWINHGFPDEIVRWLGPLVDDGSLSDESRSAAAGMITAAFHSLGRLDEFTAMGMKSLNLAEKSDYLGVAVEFWTRVARRHPSPP